MVVSFPALLTFCASWWSGAKFTVLNFVDWDRELALGVLSGGY